MLSADNLNHGQIIWISSDVFIIPRGKIMMQVSILPVGLGTYRNVRFHISQGNYVIKTNLPWISINLQWDYVINAEIHTSEKKTMYLLALRQHNIKQATSFEIENRY